MVDAERPGQSLDLRVHRGFSRDRLIHIGTQILIAVSRMEIEHVVRFRNHLLGNGVGNPLAHCAVRLTGIDAIEILLIDGTEVDRAPEERGHVRDVNQDHRAAESLRIDLLPQALRREDRRILIAVIARDKGDRGSGLAAPDGGHRDLGCSIAPRRNLDSSRLHLGHNLRRRRERGYHANPTNSHLQNDKARAGARALFV